VLVEKEAALALDDDKAEAALSLFHSNWKRGMLRPSPSKDAAVTINYHYLPNLDCCMSAVPLIRELVCHDTTALTFSFARWRRTEEKFDIF